MKRMLAALALGVFAWSAAGCNESSEGGLPGSHDTFKLIGGTTPTFIKPGDAESVKITLQRGNNFHHTVRFQTEAPAMIAANLDRHLVKVGESPDVNVRLRPKENAAPGEYKVQVIATPDTGAPATLELTVHVISK